MIRQRLHSSEYRLPPGVVAFRASTSNAAKIAQIVRDVEDFFAGENTEAPVSEYEPDQSVRFDSGDLVLSPLPTERDPRWRVSSPEEIASRELDAASIVQDAHDFLAGVKDRTELEIRLANISYFPHLVDSLARAVENEFLLDSVRPQSRFSNATAGSLFEDALQQHVLVKHLK